MFVLDVKLKVLVSGNSAWKTWPEVLIKFGQRSHDSLLPLVFRSIEGCGSIGTVSKQAPLAGDHTLEIDDDDHEPDDCPEAREDSYNSLSSCLSDTWPSWPFDCCCHFCDMGWKAFTCSCTIPGCFGNGVWEETTSTFHFWSPRTKSHLHSPVWFQDTSCLAWSLSLDAFFPFCLKQLIV